MMMTATTMRIVIICETLMATCSYRTSYCVMVSVYRIVTASFKEKIRDRLGIIMVVIVAAETMFLVGRKVR